MTYLLLSYFRLSKTKQSKTEQEKFDFAREINKHVVQFRKKFESGINGTTDTKNKKCSWAMFFIDKLALRPGCFCTLTISNTKLIEEDGQMYVEFKYTDKCGKPNQIRLIVKKKVYTSFKEYLNSKPAGTILVFESIDSTKLNSYLKDHGFLKGTCSSYFRTHQACVMFENILNAIDCIDTEDKKFTTDEKITYHNVAIGIIAGFLNHDGGLKGENNVINILLTVLGWRWCEPFVCLLSYMSSTKRGFPILD